MKKHLNSILHSKIYNVINIYTHNKPTNSMTKHMSTELYSSVITNAQVLWKHRTLHVLPQTSETMSFFRERTLSWQTCLKAKWKGCYKMC